MKKKLFLIFTVMALCISMMTVSLSAFAADSGYERIMDEADLISDSEESALLQKLNEISERQGVDVVVVTAYSLNGTGPRAFADDYFDYNGYGMGSDRSGVLLLHSPEKRDWYISTRGTCIRYFTDAGIDYIGEKIKPLLKENDFAGAYTEFANLCDKFITQGKNGSPYDIGNLPFEGLELYWIPLSLGIGLIIALIIVFAAKSKLKSVRSKSEASNYLVNNSFFVNESTDFFLYSNVTKTRVQSSSSSGGSSTHRSSSGATHGGGGGKY